MTRTDDTERDRVGREYAAYARSPRKRRAWDAENPGNRAIREEVAQRLLPTAAAADRILDIGCGSAWWLERLEAEGVPATALHGVDLLPGRVDAARSRVPGAVIQAADARRLPLEDESFGFVSLFTVLSSMRDRDAAHAALVEAARVTAPGGTIAVWDVRVPNPLNRATIRLGRADYEAALGPSTAFERVTVFPPLARRIGPALYRRLAAIGPLTTHWLITCSAPGQHPRSHSAPEPIRDPGAPP